MAPTATARNAKMVCVSEWTIAVIAAAIQTKTDPYTDGVSRQPNQTNFARSVAG